MNLSQVVVLAVIQGLAELLPVSSSAHVIVAEKLMGLDPSSPEMTLLLAGTMQLKSATDREVIGIDEKEPIAGQQSASPTGGGGI